jgi:hypothetical protein
MTDATNKPDKAQAPAGSKVLALLSKNITAVIGSGIGAALLFVFWTTWENYEIRLKNFIIQTTVEEMNKENNRLTSALSKAMGALRKSEVGALHAGNFVLTPTNRSYRLYIYFPDGYSGVLHYKITGDIIPKRRYIALQGPKSQAIPISDMQGSLDLAKYLQFTASEQAQINEELFNKTDFVKGLRAITFQLEGSDSDISELAAQTPLSNPGFEVSYVSFIAPAIQMRP